MHNNRDLIHKHGNFVASRSGGNGGQNVNKVNTKITLTVRLSDLSLKQEILDILEEKYGDRIQVYSSASRSQHHNKQDAVNKVVNIIEDTVIAQERISTKPSKEALLRQQAEKKKKSFKKELRRTPNLEEI